MHAHTDLPQLFWDIIETDRGYRALMLAWTGWSWQMAATPGPSMGSAI